MADRLSPGSAGFGRFRVDSTTVEVRYDPQSNGGGWPEGVTETRATALVRDAAGQLGFADISVDVTKAAAVFDPEAHGALAGLFDPATVSVSPGSGVGTLANTSAGGAVPDFSQGYAPHRPVLQETNGVQWIRFENWNDHRLVLPYEKNFVNHHLFVLVVSYKTSGENVIFGHTTDNTQLGFASDDSVRVVANPAIWNNELGANVGPINGEWQLWEAQLVNSGTSYVALNDFIEVSTTTSQGGAVYIDALGFVDLAANAYFNGGIGKFLIYDISSGTLGAADRDAIVAHMLALRDDLNGVT